MDIKNNGNKYKALFYAVPFCAGLCGSVNFLIFVAKSLPAAAVFAFVVIHLLFLLSISAVCGNIMIEICLFAFENRKNSALRQLIYGGRRFLPVKSAVFVLIFVVLYVILTQMLADINPVKLLVLAVPAIAIFLNSRYFLSGRVRLIGDTYLLFQSGFKAVLSYKTDELGNLVFVTDDGETLKTGVSQADGAFKTLEEEFQKNGLALAGKSN